jgi:hypothetical protein
MGESNTVLISPIMWLSLAVMHRQLPNTQWFIVQSFLSEWQLLDAE